MDVTLIILAGGNSKRINHLNTILPKSALLIYDECALIRNLRQAIEAGFNKIIISTRPSFLKLIQKLVKKSNLSISEKAIRIVRNRHHRYGALPALLQILNDTDSSRIALALSDIFFLENAYQDLYVYSQLTDDYLAVAKPTNEKELSKGGIVICNSSYIDSIIESPIEGNTNGVRWSGIAVFNRNISLALENFISAEKSSSPIGNFFEYYRARGNILRPFLVSDFINVNTPDDLFLASMYRAMELCEGNNELHNLLTEATRSIRTYFL